MSDLAFEQMLAAHNQEFQDAEEYGTQWMPPDGNYTVVVSAVKNGTFVSKKTNKSEGWWKLTGRIESDISNPDLYGKEFQIGYYTTEGKKMGFVKGVAKTLNGGISVADLSEAATILSGAEGFVLDVKVVTTEEKTRKFTNCYIQKVIATPESDAGEVTPGS
jgi:hypothetical protein